MTRFLIAIGCLSTLAACPDPTLVPVIDYSGIDTPIVRDWCPRRTLPLLNPDGFPNCSTLTRADLERHAQLLETVDAPAP